MTKDQLKKKREKLGFSQAKLAEEISEKILKGIVKPIGDRTISMMETGDRAIQPYVEKYFKEYAD
jgi:transcriptional regulator with XRE-family HTH domain